jgi:PKD repeat protein
MEVNMTKIHVITSIVLLSLAATAHAWPEWAYSAGGYSTDYGKIIKSDPIGNVYIMGNVSNEASFGIISPVYYGSNFLAKMNPTGDFLWVHTFPGVCTDMSVDNNGNTYLIGRFNQVATFGPYTLVTNSENDIFIAKLDTDGNWQWVNQTGGQYPDAGEMIEAANDGYLYVTGLFTRTVSFGSTILTSINNETRQFLGKLDTAGNWIWADMNQLPFVDFTVQNDGTICFTGYFHDGFVWGPYSIGSDGSSDVFVAKRSSNGDYLGLYKGGGLYYQAGTSISCDSQGNCYVTGHFSDAAQFGGTSLVANNAVCAFVAKLDAAGAWTWAIQPVGANSAESQLIDTNSSGIGLIRGTFSGSIQFGSTTLSGGAYQQKFLTQFDSDGNWLWAKKVPYELLGGIPYSKSINCTDSGSSYVTGGYKGTIAIGSSYLTSVSSNYEDIYVCKIAAPDLVLYSPNGGEQWRTGTVKTIYWQPSTFLSYVNIKLSTDNGVTWDNINQDPINASLGLFSFIVPNTASTQCLIRIEESQSGLFSDTSESLFSIVTENPPQVYLTAPTNAKLQSGREYAINWLGVGITAVDLGVSYDYGQSWSIIAQNLPITPSTYYWTVPDTTNTACYLKVTCSTNPSIYDLSDAPFTICKLELLSPNGGELYRVNTDHYIACSSQYVDNIRYEYSTDNGISWTLITQLYGNWHVPDIPSGQYLVRVSDMTDPVINDISDAVFTVARLVITFPTESGIKLQVGRDYNITWDGSCLPGTIRIQMSATGFPLQIIASGIPASDGSYNWQVPDTPSTNCRITIVSEQHSEFENQSSNAFKICRLLLLSPNGGELFGSQTMRFITWTQTNTSTLKLEYSLNNGSDWLLIIGNVPSDGGSYGWNVPLTNSDQCLVRITDAESDLVWDVSDGTFIIRPQVIISSPNGGEELLAAYQYIIQWSATSDLANVLIDYSINNGTDWLPVQSTPYPASVEMFNWIIPDNPSQNCIVRVRSAIDETVFDVSDDPFTITNEMILPIIDFAANVQEGDIPLTVQFNEVVDPGVGVVASRLWDFGDGSTSTQSNPQYIYTTPGTYTVSLTISNSFGGISTETKTDYITALPNTPRIELLSPSKLHFGTVYFGDTSSPQPIVVKNVGTAILHISSVSYYQNPSQYSLSGTELPLEITPGDSTEMYVVFIPLVSGTANDSLYIHSDAVNSPDIVIRLNGVGEYVPPAPPGNVNIVMNGYDAVISWDAVTQTIYGTPITPDGYLVFYNGSSDPETGLYYYLAVTDNLSYTHVRVAEFAEHMFYHVIAYKYYGRGEPDLTALETGMREEEVLRLLR